MKEEKMMKIHPNWKRLMEYIEKSGGYLRLEIRFQYGLPISAEHIKEQIRFDIKSNKNDKNKIEV